MGREGGHLFDKLVEQGRIGDDDLALDCSLPAVTNHFALATFAVAAEYMESKRMVEKLRRNLPVAGEDGLPTGTAMAQKRGDEAGYPDGFTFEIADKIGRVGG